MLVLSRCLDEKLVFIDPLRPDQPFTLQVVDIRGDKVRLGLTLPDDVGCWREELLPLNPKSKIQNSKSEPEGCA